MKVEVARKSATVADRGLITGKFVVQLQCGKRLLGSRELPSEFAILQCKCSIGNSFWKLWQLVELAVWLRSGNFVVQMCWECGRQFGTVAPEGAQKSYGKQVLRAVASQLTTM